MASGLSFPLYLTAPAGDAARLFIVEKGGAIRIVKDGALLPTPFLDLTGRVSTGGEQGLLGLAFDPAYADQRPVRGALYRRRRATRSCRCSGCRRTMPTARTPPARRSSSPPSSRSRTTTAARSLFGPDGMLYIGLGDGGSGGDPGGRGQSLTDLLGSILRVDVRSGTGYTVPPDNPFVGQADARPGGLELRPAQSVALHASIRPPATSTSPTSARTPGRRSTSSRAAAGAGRGANFGWNLTEGPPLLRHGRVRPQPRSPCPCSSTAHDEGCSITGGFVYRGAAIPALQGHYFYADYCQGWVRSFRLQDGQAVEPQQWPTLAPGGSVPSFGQDAAGELYVLSAEGRVFRIVPR